MIDRYRSRRPIGDLPESMHTPGDGPEEIALRRETQMELRTALTYLTDQQQDVVTLRLAGLKGREIAIAMNTSHGAVKSLQIRAFARLRDLMEPPFGNEKEARDV